MEKVIVLLDNSSTRIERIYSYGEVSPVGFYYNQDEDEFVKIEDGNAIIEVEGKEIFMNKGDELFLPRHAKHRINYTSDNCVWYCVFKKY